MTATFLFWAFIAGYAGVLLLARRWFTLIVIIVLVAMIVDLTNAPKNHQRTESLGAIGREAVLS